MIHNGRKKTYVFIKTIDIIIIFKIANKTGPTQIDIGVIYLKY